MSKKPNFLGHDLLMLIILSGLCQFTGHVKNTIDMRLKFLLDVFSLYFIFLPFLYQVKFQVLQMFHLQVLELMSFYCVKSCLKF